MKTTSTILGLAVSACSGELPNDKIIPDTAMSATPDSAVHVTDDSRETRPPPIQGTTIDEPPPLPTVGERPVEVVRHFDCAPEGVGSELVVGGIEGRSDEVLLLKPAPETCAFHLYVRRASDGRERRLSSGAGSGWLFAAGTVLSDGRVAVCANDVHHVADPSNGRRYVSEVTIACTSSDSAGNFAPMTPVLVPDGEWAAWLRGVAPDADGKGVVMTFVHDFSYQFMNLSDAGRPPEDGIYALTISWSDVGVPVVASGSPAKIAARTNPLADAALTPWEPSDEEKAALQGLTQ